MDPEACADYLEDCMRVCRAGRLVPLEWQRRCLRQMLSTAPSGLWAAGTVGNSVPRQNGKTLGVTEARVAFGMVVLNELALYTSHLQKTSTETFEDMANLFDSRSLRRYVKTIRTALGREAIVLKSGAQIKFLARTRNGGRGQHCDLLVFDEAQELTDEQQASFLPTQAASSNPQTVYTGTPPDEGAPGTVFRRIRERALSGAPGMAWAEWAVDEMGDVTDRGRWYETNPSLGTLILESSVENECNDMAADKFARERLGWWSPEASLSQRVIDPDEWNACRTDSPPADGLMGVGVKFAPDGSRVALAVCLRPDDGKPYVEVVRASSTSRGTRWVAEWLDARRDKIASAAVDGKRGESTVQALSDAHFPRKAVHVPGSADVAKACAMLVDAVQSGAVEHYGQPDLDAAATTCARRRIGMDGFGFDDTETGDSTLIEACALAYREAMTTKRRPGRKAVVY